MDIIRIIKLFSLFKYSLSHLFWKVLNILKIKVYNMYRLYINFKIIHVAKIIFISFLLLHIAGVMLIIIGDNYSLI